MYTLPVAVIAVTEARASLPGILARVEAGEEVTLTRHGRAVAVLLHPDALRARRAGRAFADADRVRRLIEGPPTPTGNGADSGLDGGLDVAWAERLVAEIRADRDSD